MCLEGNRRRGRGEKLCQFENCVSAVHPLDVKTHRGAAAAACSIERRRGSHLLVFRLPLFLPRKRAETIFPTLLCSRPTSPQPNFFCVNISFSRPRSLSQRGGSRNLQRREKIEEKVLKEERAPLLSKHSSSPSSNNGRPPLQQTLGLCAWAGGKQNQSARSTAFIYGGALDTVRYVGMPAMEYRNIDSNSLASTVFESPVQKTKVFFSNWFFCPPSNLAEANLPSLFKKKKKEKKAGSESSSFFVPSPFLSFCAMSWKRRRKKKEKGECVMEEAPSEN